MKILLPLSIKMTALVVVTVSTILPNFTNASLSDATVVFESGDWSVRRSVDSFTDEVSCIGIYQDNFAMQLSKHSFYVAVRGGIKAIQLRYDSQPPEKLRLPTDTEKGISAVIFGGINFTHLREANRVRIQILTVLDKVKQFDINLTDMTMALENIRKDCPE